MKSIDCKYAADHNKKYKVIFAHAIKEVKTNAFAESLYRIPRET